VKKTVFPEQYKESDIYSTPGECINALISVTSAQKLAFFMHKNILSVERIRHHMIACDSQIYGESKRFVISANI
jgi:hypothetical protein